jgi:hypothetical protein|tara:strand:+ start:167 stop:382 length:216 start_codon:yes stop_codon:yes gene_type:complete
MDVIYALAGIILMIFTCFITWINWRILRVSEDLLEVSQVLLDETILVRKGLNRRTKSTKILNEPIPGTKIK